MIHESFLRHWGLHLAIVLAFIELAYSYCRYFLSMVNPSKLLVELYLDSALIIGNRFCLL